MSQKRQSKWNLPKQIQPPDGVEIRERHQTPQRVVEKQLLQHVRNILAYKDDKQRLTGVISELENFAARHNLLAQEEIIE